MKHQLILKFIAVITIFSWISCNDDEDIVKTYSEYSESLAGEWYRYQGMNENLQRRTFFEIERDGSYFTCKAEMARDGAVDYGYGSYTLNGKRLKLAYKMYEMLMTEEYEIRSVGKYDMHLFLPSLQQEETNYRIIETKHIKVGETAKALISDWEFIPNSYQSDDERVVKVDNTGTFHALRQGTAYVLIHSSIGTAVIRVVVEVDTYIEDFIKYMGENIRMAANAYGPNIYSDGPFGDTGLNVRYYYLIDDIISELLFLYNQDGTVEQIMLQLRYPTDVEKVKKAFYNQYQYEEERDGSYFYGCKKNGREISINVSQTDGIIYYKSSYDPFAEIDDIVKEIAVMSVTELFDECGIPEEMKNDGFVILNVSNEVFTCIIVFFDSSTDKIKEIDLEAEEGVSLEDLDGWYRQHYIITQDYGYMNPTPRLHIRFDLYEGVYFVKYYITK